ncbi:50S ribosomal protein L19, partial [Candidatus Phytoplasma asteris]|uniref:50S ribosomal protein L19 n=1 Tax=Candidatus Phytoplasma asteris TaxID=85620 RepID=UPI0039E02907
MNKNNIKHYKHLNPISQNVQIFEGLVIKRQGRLVTETFTVRKIFAGVGIELNSNKGIDFYSRHLFGFSRTCFSCPQESFLALFTYDIIKEIELS